MGHQTDAVIAAILGQIDQGRLSPGDTIDEAALAADLGVSRTPIREALLQLEAIGLIERPPRKGAVVFQPDIRDFLAILEVHAKLEGHAAGLAARRLSTTRGAALEAAISACEAHVAEAGETNPAAYYQLNLTFHKVVAEASANPFLVDLVKSNARKLMAYYRARYRFAGVISTSAADHRAIGTAILDGDAGAAEALMLAHVQFDQATALDLLAIFE